MRTNIACAATATAQAHLWSY